MNKGGLLWGLMLLLGGTLFLLDNLGFLPISALSIFFPSVLILIGLWFLVGPLVFRRVVESRSLAIPTEGVTEARLKLRHGAGALTVKSMTGGLNLLEGTFSGGVEEKINHEGSGMKVKLSVPETEWWGFPSASPSGGFNWDMMLNRNTAFSLDIMTGASKTCLDLHDLIITDLNMEAGANEMDITLPEQAGKTRCHFQFGTARLELHVPANVAAQIKIDGALLDTNEIDPVRFPRIGEVFCSPNYSAAANTVEILIEAGMGKVVIH